MVLNWYVTLCVTFNIQLALADITRLSMNSQITKQHFNGCHNMKRLTSKLKMSSHKMLLWHILTLEKPYNLYTDASGFAVGAILLQEYDGVEQLKHCLSKALI